MIFDFESTKIYQAVKWGKHPFFRWLGFLKNIFLLFFSLSLFLFLFGFFTQSFSPNLLIFSLASSIFLFVFWIESLLLASFFNSKIKNPEPHLDLTKLKTPPVNLASFLSFETAKGVFSALKFAKSKNISPINSTILFYFLLKENNEIGFLFWRLGLDFLKIKKDLKQHIKSFLRKTEKENKFSEDFNEVFLLSLNISKEKNHQKIELGDVIIALSEICPFFKNLLLKFGLKKEDIENVIWWMEAIKEREKEKKKWWSLSNLLKKGSLGREWISGYTLTLDRYSFDLTKIFKKEDIFSDSFFHQQEVEMVERILAQPTLNNVLLVGNPGTGRKSIIQILARKILCGESMEELNYKRVVELDLQRLLSEIVEKELEEKILDEIFQEVIESGNVILVIDELHNFINEKNDISPLLSPYLRFPQFRIIGITNYGGLHQVLEKKPSFLRFFKKVEVKEPSKQEVLKIIEYKALVLERKYKIFVTYPALKRIIQLTDRYLPSLYYPQKAVDLLEESIVFVKKTLKESSLLASHIDKLMSQKVEIPLGEIEEREKKVLLNLENLLHQRIINQELAIKEVAVSLRRSRTEIEQRRNRPMGSFLFLGPTGVGKTETAKALTEIYFGSESKMIRLDMSEFQNVQDIPRLIGSYEREGLLTTPVRENPFSLVLLDEIEKAHPNILNLFLQILDEGYITDGRGRKVSFKDTIIISTSNAGYKIILKALKEKIKWEDVKKILLDYLFEKGVFRPEFINRFDAVVLFKPLTKQNLLDIAHLMLQKVKKGLREKGIEFLITDSLKEKIVKLGYNPLFGAREMRRVIQDKVENSLATAFLIGKIKSGDTIEIDPETFQVKVVR